MNTHVTRVLAVDDDADMRTIYEESVHMIPLANQENTRFSLTLAKDGIEAIEAVKQSVHGKEPFAVAFLDLKMPPLPDGGIWTAKKIREIDTALNIVLVTGCLDIDPLDLSHRIRPLDKFLYLQKPCSIYEIQQCALSLGAKWRAEALLRETNEELYLTNRQLLDTNTSLSILARNLDKTRKETEKQLLDRLRSILRPFLIRLSNDPSLARYEDEFRAVAKEIEDNSSNSIFGMVEADCLSSTELAIASMVRKGASSKDVAQTLNISIDTVKTHRRNIRRKLRIQHAHISLQAYLHSVGEADN